MTPDAIADENERMMNTLALLAENRRLRLLCARAGLSAPVALREHLADLAMLIAEQHGFTVDQLRGPARSHSIVDCRQHFMWAARQARAGVEHRWSLTQIGDFLGRDHSTVTHGVRAHERALALQSSEEQPIGVAATRDNTGETT